MRVGFSGHQQMPQEALNFASDVINEYLVEHEGATGICSLAAGSDQLFAKAVVDRGHQLHVVIPCENYESTFDRESLDMYRSLLVAASWTEVLDFDAPSEEAFFAAGKRVADLSDELLAVWDGQSSRGLGGTADVVAYTRGLNKNVHVIWPDGLKR
ncbi:hypothetical protein [Rhodococcus sp. BS-15]|uniref:hypothetical protein n=1 Tax=Rhodococcus sp. BS-15 TaxID=1304954 RepID=UPI000FFC3793|nr:hypothetical protein [Rhodococcus sp. BS-15]